MKTLKIAILMMVCGLFFQIQMNYGQTAAEFIERAQAAQAKEDYGDMIKNASAAVTRDSGNALAYFLRGLAYFSQKNYAEAVSDAAKVIEINPNIAEAYFLHAVALTILRPTDWKIVLTDLDKSIRLDPTFATAFRQRARIHNEYDHDFTAALADAGQAVKLDPKYADGFFERGRANQNLKNLAAAESDYSNAIKLGRNSADTYNHRGVVYFLQNNREAAIADFRRALELEPDDKQAQENLELAQAKNTDPGNSTPSNVSPSASQSNISIPYAFGNATYEKVMPAAEEIFRKLTTHHYPAPKQVSYMGRTEIVDPFGVDKNTLAIRLNSVLQAMRSILESRYVNELTPEQLQLCRERLDKAEALQADAARLHLVTLEKVN